MESSQERFEYLKSKNYTLKLLHEELGRDINIQDPLPAEPVLAEQLLCSRSEAREAIIILECFGYVSCRSRSNNIIVKNFNEPPNDTYQYFKKLYDSSEDFKKFYISLDGKYKEGDNLPGERVLAKSINFSRQKAHELLVRLECFGYLDINHGKPCKVLSHL